MENLLHILKLIKQTKCEKQAKLPSTLQSRYTYTNRGYTNKHTHTQRDTYAGTQKNGTKKQTSEGNPTHTHVHVHVQLNIYSNNELRWPKCCQPEDDE